MTTLKENVHHFANNHDKLCPRTVNKDVKKKKALADVGNTCHSQTPMADISKRNVIPFKSIQSTNTPLKEIQNLEKFSAKKNPSFQKLSSVKKSSKDKRLVNSHMYDDEYYKCYCDGMYEHRDVPVHPKITNEDTPMRMGWIKTENTNYTQPKKYVGRAKPEDFGLVKPTAFYSDLDNICKLDDLLAYLDE